MRSEVDRFHDGPILSEEKGQHVIFLVTLLPYVEQHGIAKNLDITAGTYAPVNAAARMQQIHVYLCPSFPVGRNSEGSSGLANYAGCHHDSETPIDQDNNGLLYLNSKIRYSDILVGSSNNFLIGETLPIQDSLGWASGTLATLRNTSDRIDWYRWESNQYNTIDEPE